MCIQRLGMCVPVATVHIVPSSLKCVSLWPMYTLHPAAWNVCPCGHCTHCTQQLGMCVPVATVHIAPNSLECVSLWPLYTSPGLQAVDLCSRRHPLILQHANSSLQFVLRRQVANSPKSVRHRQCVVLTCVRYVHIVCLFPPMTWLVAGDFFYSVSDKRQ